MAVKPIKFKMTDCDRDGYVSVAQVAAKTSLSLATIYKEIKAGRLVAYTITNKTVLRPGDVERWVQIQTDRITRTTPRSNRGRKKKDTETMAVKGLTNAGTQKQKAKMPA